VYLLLLGESGNDIVGAIKSAVDKESGHKKAKEVKQLIYKMALKVKLMTDSVCFC